MKKPQIKMIIFECPHCGKTRIGKVWSLGRFECEDCGQQWNIKASKGSFEIGAGNLRPYIDQDQAAVDMAKEDLEDWFGASEKRIA